MLQLRAGKNVWAERESGGYIEGDGDGDMMVKRQPRCSLCFETIETAGRLELIQESAVTNKAKGSSLAADLRLGKVGASVPMTPRLSSLERLHVPAQCSAPIQNQIRHQARKITNRARYSQH